MYQKKLLTGSKLILENTYYFQCSRKYFVFQRFSFDVILNLQYGIYRCHIEKKYKKYIMLIITPFHICDAQQL